MPSVPETGPLSRAVLKPFTPPGMLILLAARQSGSLAHGQNPHSTMMTHLPVAETTGEAGISLRTEPKKPLREANAFLTPAG